ncbi:hypothetical protein DFH09DRAFT_1423996 [Mycena vulgaris]|nr:hypothetical protein DFH09DRAFT_1423996 [Mycena vulgaris]
MVCRRGSLATGPSSTHCELRYMHTVDLAHPPKKRYVCRRTKNENAKVNGGIGRSDATRRTGVELTRSLTDACRNEHAWWVPTRKGTKERSTRGESRGIRRREGSETKRRGTTQPRLGRIGGGSEDDEAEMHCAYAYAYAHAYVAARSSPSPYRLVAPSAAHPTQHTSTSARGLEDRYWPPSASVRRRRARAACAGVKLRMQVGRARRLGMARLDEACADGDTGRARTRGGLQAEEILRARCGPNEPDAAGPAVAVVAGRPSTLADRRREAASQLAALSDPGVRSIRRGGKREEDQQKILHSDVHTRIRSGPPRLPPPR